MNQNLLETLRKGIETSNSEETQHLGMLLAEELPENCVLLLEGDLGAGKTMLMKGLARGLGISKTIASPSFNLLLSYSGRRHFYHIDAYRIAGQLDLESLFLEDLLEKPYCVAIEWPQKVIAIPPGPRFRFHLEILPHRHHRIRLLHS